ncbi:MAG: hypothetical protein ACREA0_04615 [bacterium]
MDRSIIQPVFLVASRSPEVAQALNAFLSLFSSRELKHRALDPLVYGPIEALLDKVGQLSFEVRRNLFLVLDREPLDGLLPSLDEAELLLRYPEVTIFFIDAPSGTGEASSDLYCGDTLVTLSVLWNLVRHAAGFRPLLDPSLLRLRARDRFANTTSPPDPVGLAASLDDESSFLHLNGYIAYRGGWPVFLCPSAAEAEAVCGNNVKKLSLVVEDVELNYPDLNHDELVARYLVSDGQKPDALLKLRTVAFPGLPEADKPETGRRFVVSTSENRSAKSWVGKPHGGVFDRGFEALRTPKGEAHAAAGRRDSRTTGHAAAGRLQRIAESLLRRSRTVATEARERRDAETAIHAAVLAEEAKRLLGGKSPILSLEALALKHYSEAVAECSFVGTIASQEIRLRIDEIEGEVDTILPAQDDRTARERQRLSALVEILSDLRDVYRAFDEVDEEEVLVTKIRRVQSRLKTLRPAGKKWFAKPKIRREDLCALGRSLSFPFESYFNWLMEGFSHLFVAGLFWIAFFAFLYTRNGVYESELCFGVEAFLNSLFCFFVGEIRYLGPGLLHSGWSLAALETALGYIHLGILVAYLYQKISRR